MNRTPALLYSNVIGEMLGAAAARKDERAPFHMRYLGDPILATPCEPIGSAGGIQPGLIQAMRHAAEGTHDMRAIPDTRVGLGLAANQVGALVALCIVRVEMKGTQGKWLVLVNPRIVARSDETRHATEGCLSIPGFQTSVKRHARVTVTYRDEWFAEHPAREFTGLESQIVQHELDHLAGKQIVDGLSRQLRRQAERALAKARGL